ncbi:MAG: DUF429 domain-containing protein [Acidobacteriota bacterium]
MSSMRSHTGPVALLGIDCAVSRTNLGAAVGVFTQGRLRCSGFVEPVPSAMAAWLREQRAAGRPVLVALDAPLGWPEDLGASLASHSAGEELPGERNLLFRRETDRWVRARIGKQSLDVGADRIARTAHASLELLTALRQEADEALPMIWSPEALSTGGSIEVYPAATLRAWSFPNAGYKGASEVGRSKRREILACMTGAGVDVPEALRQEALASDHRLDALICLLAGHDFLAGLCSPPENLPQAQKEGWMWVREPTSSNVP